MAAKVPNPRHYAREHKTRAEILLENPIAKLTYESLLRMYGLDAAQRYLDASTRKTQ